MTEDSAVITGTQSDDFPIFPDAIPDRSFTITHHGYGTCITPHGHWSDECSAAMRKYDVKGINLNLWTGWKREPLDFLKPLTGITALHVFTGEKEDLTPVQALRDSLTRLALQCRVANGMDLSTFVKLTYLWCEGSSKLRHIEESTSLEELSIYGGPTYPSFDRFRRLRSLKSLTQIKGGVEELGFSFPRPEMRELKVSHCYKFASLDGLEMVPNLRSLEIVSAKKLPSIDAVAELKNLEMLVLDGCGTYESLDPILELKDLQHLSLDGSTTFKRADFMRLLDMPNLRHFICHRKQHYNKEDFEAVHWALLDRRRTNPDSGTSGNTRKETTGR